MFGYHDNDRCGFDLWSPVDTDHRCELTDTDVKLFNAQHNAHHGWDPDNAPYSARENRAFSPYAKHTQEVEDVINEIVRQARLGNTSFTIDLDDDFSDADAAYIEREVQKRLR